MNLHRSLLIVALVAGAMLLVLCKNPVIPPDKPVIAAGPTYGGVNVSYDFTATATSPEGDDIAIRFDWGNGVTDWSGFVPSGDSVTMSRTWTSPGNYAVKAQAKAETGAESEWSNSHQIAITANQPPNAPAVPSGPLSALKDSVCSFTTIATDPDGDGVAYRFDWGNGDSSEWTDWTQSGTPGGTMYAWSRGGTYSVRAQAKDANEALSVWSNPHEIAIRNQLPDTPSTPTGPSEGSINTSHEFSSSATDPDGDSISIRFSWGDGDTSSWSELAPSGSTIAMSHTWSGVGTYLIRAQTRDEEGAVSEWSSASEFETTRLIWRYRTNSAVRSSPAIESDGTVYVGSWDNYLYAFNPDGTMKWRYWTGSSIYSSPAIGTDGTVYVGSDDNYLYALNPDGTLRWRYEIGSAVSSSPAIGADGMLYVGSMDGYLYAFWGDSPLANSPWPKYRHDNKNTGRVGGP